ncbi:YvrJ family protein [Sporosarcina sp. BI001-red]
MEQLLEQTMGFIQEVGFPVFVSLYLLHRLEVKLEAIHGALITLKVK